MKAKTIGIFAGTFDPIHNGHIAYAQAALGKGLEKVMFLVEPRPRRKQGVRALEHRIAMVELAVANEPKFGVIVLEQARFTPHETLPLLQSRFAGYKMALLFGDDVISHMVDHIASWPHIEEIANSASLIISVRSHDKAELIHKLEVLRSEYGLPFSATFVEPMAAHISSSKIRTAVKKQLLEYDSPESVKQYIAKNKLYYSEDNIS